MFANLLLADEINRLRASQDAIGVAGSDAGVPGHHRGRSAPDAAAVLDASHAKPGGTEGTYPLPEAQLDRFLLKVEVAYPSVEDEAALVKRVTEGQIGDALRLDGVNAVIKPETIAGLAALGCSALRGCANSRLRRAHRATSHLARVAIGAGPRGNIGLVRAATGSRAHGSARLCHAR